MTKTLDLQALLNRDAKQKGMPARQVMDLPLAKIAADPNNPRRHFDRAELEALAGSIKRRGVIQPITVQPANAEGIYILRFGERRWRASELAGKTTVPAIVSNTATDKDSVIDQVIENDQRVDLSHVEMARAVAAMIEEGRSLAQIAEELSRPKSTIAQYSAVSAMPEELRALLDDAGLRTVYELHNVWKREPERVLAYIAGTPVERITRASVAGLTQPPVVERDETLSNRAHDAADNHASSGRGRAGGAADPTTANSSRSKPRSRPATVGAAMVTHDGKTGALVYEPCADPSKVAVLFEGKSKPVEVPAAEVRIVQVIKPAS